MDAMMDDYSTIAPYRHSPGEVTSPARLRGGIRTR